MQDSEIISAILEGGVERQRALGYVYNKSNCKGKIHRVITRYGIDMEEAQDIFHDGIITLDNCIKTKKFRGESSIDTYLFSICKFLCLNYWRKKKKMLYIEDISQVNNFEINNPVNTAEEFIKKEEKSILDKMLSEVGETCQQVLKMWQLSYSMEEISKEMSLSSPNMAKKKRFLCHKRLMLLIENKNYYSYLSESSMLAQTKAVV